MRLKIIGLLNKLGAGGIFNFTITKVVNKQSFKIPIIRKLGLANSDISEPWMIQLLEKLLTDRKDKAYIDVGVNVGQTLIQLKSVNPAIAYYGFEPNPTCIYYANELVKVNNFKNVTLFPVGISSETSVYELSFFAEDDADSAASMIKDFRKTQKVFRKEYVACFNASEILDKYNIPSIGIIKIDVEGAEKEVVDGFKDRIISDQPIIQLEILPVYNENNKERLIRQKAMEDFFKQINYTIFRIHTNNNNRLASLEEIQTIGIHSNLKWCEYLVVPESIKQEIKAIRS